VTVLSAGIAWGIVSALALGYTPGKSVQAGVDYGLTVGTVLTLISRFANRSAKPS
jgi:hypothetical protein